MRIIKSHKSIYLIAAFTSIISFTAYAQKTVITEDSLTIEFVKNERLKQKHPKTYIGNLHKGFRISLIEVNINTHHLKQRKFDPNKFYLVSDKPKFRYRPLDIFIVKNKTNWKRFDLVTKKKPKFTSQLKSTYNPNIKDTYLDYKIEGVSGIRIPINLGSIEQPDKHIFHFKPKVLEYNKVVLYFYISSDFIKTGTLYYGKYKISDTYLK